MISQSREAYKILLVKWKSACLLPNDLYTSFVSLSSFASKIHARVGLHKPTIWRVRWVDDTSARDQPQPHVTSARASDQRALAFGSEEEEERAARRATARRAAPPRSKRGGND